MSRLRELFRARLALWIYLVGLAQFAAVVAGFWAVLAVTRPPGSGPADEHFRFIAGTIERAIASPALLKSEIERVSPTLCSPLTVVDPDGELRATSDPGGLRCDAPGKASDGNSFCIRQPVRFPDGRMGAAGCRVQMRPPFTGWQIILTVLTVVGVSSLLLARTLTRPLRQLSAAARALGGGDLAARVGLRRGDELGEVANAFDDMAARVAGLVRSEKELLANVSHELRTPLARIRVALDLASEGDQEVAREMFVDIAGDLDELEKLLGDVLTAARLDLAEGSAGLPPLRRERLDARDLLDQAAARLRSVHPERTLRIDVAGELPSLDGDRVLLRRALDNLLENAHRYSDRAEAPVTLAARAGGDALVVEVIDQGVGIAPDDLPMVFRPFFRADRSRARATGGLGLGLALTRRIVEAHGGTIAIESAVDQGTCVRISLPSAPR